MHPIPPEIALEGSAYKFLIGDELLGSKETAIFIEHECKNTMLSAIRNRKRLITPWGEEFMRWLLEQTRVSGLLDEKPFVSSLTVLPSLVGNPVVLNLDVSTGRLDAEDLYKYKISNIFNETPWIADRILKSQLGLKRYATFGGFEYNIVNRFHDTRDIYFLETTEDYYNVLRENKWGKAELFKKINSTLIDLNVISRVAISQEQFNFLYNWEWVNDSPYPLDAILDLARNKLWITNLIEKGMLERVLKTKKNVLIVVGFAHLMEKLSFGTNVGFLKLLIDTIRPTKTFRYSYKSNNWISWV